MKPSASSSLYDAGGAIYYKQQVYANTQNICRKRFLIRITSMYQENLQIVVKKKHSCVVFPSTGNESVKSKY